jgi:uncharacterized membrane protein
VRILSRMSLHTRVLWQRLLGELDASCGMLSAAHVLLAHDKFTSIQSSQLLLLTSLAMLQMHRVIIHTFERRLSKPYIWRSKTLELHTLVSTCLYMFAFRNFQTYCVTNALSHSVQWFLLICSMVRVRPIGQLLCGPLCAS